MVGFNGTTALAMAASAEPNGGDMPSNNSNHKAALSSSNFLSTPDRGTTSLPLRKSKKKKASRGSHKKAASRKSTVPKHGAALTDQDLADHVSHLYIHGPGGVLRETERRRARQEHELGRRQMLLEAAAATAAQEEAHLATLRNLDHHPALLLNADFQPMSYLPLSLWNWQEAIKAVFSGKVTVVEVYPDVTIRAATLEVPLPSVIALTEYVPQFQQTPAFTKRNVFLRDEYRCQYCQDLFHTRDLSLDHVVPRCKGGRLHWSNAVTSCRRCNGRKGSLDVGEISRLGMRLVREPRTPTQYELAATASRMLPRRVHPAWEPYLGAHHKKKTTLGSAAGQWYSREQQSQTLKDEAL
jgi:5-methylcytosine-specific restriction endonuclease McrA